MEELVDCFCASEEQLDSDAIHVIEKSAFDALKALNDAQSLEIEKAKELLQKYRSFTDHTPKCNNDMRTKCICGLDKMNLEARAFLDGKA